MVGGGAYLGLPAMNGPGKRKKPGRSYGSRVLEKGLDVVHFLASGDILGWKSLRQVAAGVSWARRAQETPVRYGRSSD